MKQRQKIEIGKPYGELTVIRADPGIKNNRRHTLCVCRCACGNVEDDVTAGILLRGAKKRCLQCSKHRESPRPNQTHGLTKHPLYRVRRAMIERCHHPNRQGYEDYGARGITVCDEWREAFLPFYEWALANGWAPGLSIDREDNDGPYSPENCRFVDDFVQANNRRNNVMVTAFGETKSVHAWLRDPRCSITRASLDDRLQSGMDPEEAISKPATRGKGVKYIHKSKMASSDTSPPRPEAP